MALLCVVSGRGGPVEVQRGSRRAPTHSAPNLAGWGMARPTLRSGEARIAGWGPARPTALRLSPVEVRRGPPRSRAGSGGPARPTAIKSWQMRSEDHCDILRSRAGRWGPARTTAIKSWQMRSGEAHCDQELAEEVRRGPLRSRAGRWGPARPTAIKSWQMRSGEAHCDQELADEVRRGRKEEEGGRRSRISDIKSKNLHLAGGEWINCFFVKAIIWLRLTLDSGHGTDMGRSFEV